MSYYQNKTQTSRAGELLSQISGLVRDREGLQQTKAVMDSVVGYPAVYTNLAAIYGWAEADCEALYNTVAGAVAALDAAAITSLTANVGL